MKSFRFEIKWAIIFVLVSLLWMLFERAMGWHDEHIDQHATYSNFVAIPAIIIYVLALLDKRKNHYGGHMSYAQGFMSGLVITVIVTLLSPLTQYITSAFITPQFFPNAIKHAVSTNAMTQEAADKYFNLKSYIIQGLIGAPVMGIVTTLVVAIFTRRK
jgi:hypothetical protein